MKLLIFPPVIHAGETLNTILLKYTFSTFLKENYRVEKDEIRIIIEKPHLLSIITNLNATDRNMQKFQKK